MCHKSAYKQFGSCKGCTMVNAMKSGHKRVRALSKPLSLKTLKSILNILKRSLRGNTTIKLSHFCV